MGEEEDRIKRHYKALRAADRKANRGVRVNDRFMTLARRWKKPIAEIKRIVGYDHVPGENVPRNTVEEIIEMHETGKHVPAKSLAERRLE